MIVDKKNKGIISTLFGLLGQENIRYLVLRNYENLPERPIEGSDVDMLIDEKSEKKYFLVFKKAVSEAGGFILFKIRQPNCLSCFVYQKTPFIFGTWIDAFLNISTRGFIFANSEYLLKKRIRHEKGFFIPSPGGEAAVLFAKEVLNRSFLKKRYRLKIPDLVKTDKENFVKTLGSYFNKKNIEEMFQICLGGKWDEVAEKRKRWRFNLIKDHFLRRPLNQTFRFLDFASSQVKKFVFPLFRKGLIVAVFGPDGVGKTTVCKGLKERIKNFPARKIHQYHSHIGIFPELRRVYNWFLRKKDLKEETTDFRGKKLGLWRATLYLFYYGFEHLLTWPWILWLRMREDVVIFDRFFYDFSTADTHSSAKIYFFLLSAISKIIPRPDLAIVLTASPEKIYERKKELSLAEIKRQTGAFESSKIFKLLPTVFINNEQKPDKVLDKIEEEILNVFLKRYDGK